ncbi:MAG: amidohydrolase [Clostridia bacterium]|nr:amidohydrolase [Clostridia bacterium]
MTQPRRKIDCHTHIVTPAIRQEYFSRTNGYAIVMQFLSMFRAPPTPDEATDTVRGDARLFLCPCIDIHADIPTQLAAVEAALPHERIVGLKIYLTYQSGRANDPRMIPIYEFAARHQLTVTYHTGSCALTLPSDNDLDGSNAVYVAEMAERYPTVNFIVAHMDDPRYMECIPIVCAHENMYTDFSGAYEPGTPEGDSMDWAIDTFARAIRQCPDAYRHILYGTDFCPPINLSAIEDYDVTIARLFPAEQHDDIYFNNALRAFPRIAEYLRKDNSNAKTNV